MTRVAVVFGTRPEAVKMAPFIGALRDDPRFDPIVLVTGQHREMLDQVLDVFGIVPDIDLDLMVPGQTLADITARTMTAVHDALTGCEADVVAVQGDTTTTFVSALAAFYSQRPVVHLEAGLRTSNRYSPFPEEVNRRLTTQLASLHLAPTARAATMLLDEGIPAADVVVTGNTVIDALQQAVAATSTMRGDVLDRIRDDHRRVVLVTTHRRESWGEPMAATARALRRLADDRELLVVLPAHRNPVVRDVLNTWLSDVDNIWVCEPLPYGEFVSVLARSTLVLTDSGGIQEEAPSLGKPVLVLRDTTERPEAVQAGTVAMVGTNENEIFERARTLLDDDGAYAAMANAVNPYGDGTAAARSVDALAYHLGFGPKPPDFEPQGQFSA